MCDGFKIIRRGYTIVELMVAVVIVAVLAATLGTFVVKLLTLQERDREEAYIREQLVDICGIYADYLSIGTTVITNASNQSFAVKYRQEAGGVSFETGRVSRVVQLESVEKPYTAMNKACRTVALNTFDAGGDSLNFSKEFRGDDLPLMTVKDLKIRDNSVNLRCGIRPLKGRTGTAALWNLEVRADYVVRNDEGDLVPKYASVERVVRLWNCK